MESNYYRVKIICFLCLCISQGAWAQRVIFNNTLPLCFQYTWLGPRYDVNDLNTTRLPLETNCTTHLSGAENIPCRMPFIVSANGSKPDRQYLEENYGHLIVSRMPAGNVCAKFTYSFNNEVQNITYMWIRAYLVGQGPQMSGCFQQWKHGYSVEVCLCETSVNDDRPCNDASFLRIPMFLLIILLIFNFVENQDNFAKLMLYE